MVTGVLDSPDKVSVTPGITPVTVLLALSIGMPSTVSDGVMPIYRHRVKPIPSPFVPVVSFEMVIWPAAPEVWLTNAKRAPELSVMTEAVTPRFCLLM